MEQPVDIRSLTAQGLNDYLEAGTGVPVPSNDADRETCDAWYVATVFAIFHRNAKDVAEADQKAINELRQSPPGGSIGDTPARRLAAFKKIVPLIETALGRKLTADEIGGRTASRPNLVDQP